MARRPGRVAGVLLVLALVLGACAGDAREPATTASDLLVDWSAQQARDFIDDETDRRPVLVNKWASWCPPCRDEAPHLAAAAKRYGDTVTFLGVNFEDERAAAAAFLDRFGVSFRSIHDPDGDVARELGLVQGIPVTAVYDLGGVEVFRRVGTLTESELVNVLDEVARP